MMFQKSLQRDKTFCTKQHGYNNGNHGDNHDNDIDEGQPAVGAWMKNYSKVKNLEKHLDGKDASEDVVKVGQHKIPDHIGDDDDENFLKDAMMPIL